ncbi:MAG: RNA methyltransferase, partial [Chitinophagaceae bacterium]
MLSRSQLKYIQSLGHKKCRDEEGVFIAEGPKVVTELLRQKNVKIKEVVAVKEWREANDKLLESTTVSEVSMSELERVSQLTTPNQVLAVAEKIKWKNELLLKGSVSIVLDMIQDPGNLGTIIRTADWFGIKQIICSKDSADIYNPKVVQATMGSIGRVRVEYVDLAAWLNEKKEVRIFAAALDGMDISKMEKMKEGIIIIGNESKGI